MTYIILRDMCGDLTTIPNIEFDEFNEEALGDAVFNAVETIMESMETEDYSNENILLASEELAIFRSVEKVGDLSIEDFIRQNAIINYEDHEYKLYLKLKEKYENV